MSEENLNLDVNTGIESEAVDTSPSTEQDSYSKEEVSKLLKALHTERDARKAQEKALKESATKLHPSRALTKPPTTDSRRSLRVVQKLKPHSNPVSLSARKHSSQCVKKLLFVSASLRDRSAT